MPKLSRNIFYNFVGQGSLLILGFVAVRFVFRRLGEDALGIIYFTLALNAVLCAALEMGVCTTTVREVSSHYRSKPGYIQELIQTASFLYWAAYVLLAGAVYFGAPLLVEKWITLKTMDPLTAIRALRILGIGAVLALPTRFYASLFQGIERMAFNNILDVCNWALQQSGTIVILVSGGRFLHVVGWMAACFSLTNVAYMFVIARFFSWKALIPMYSPRVTRRNMRFSLHAASISFLGVIHTQADKVILSKLLPVGVMGYYGLAFSIISRASLITGAIAPAALPSLSGVFVAEDYGNLTSKYRKLQDLVCLTTVPVFAAILFFVLPVFTRLFNGEIARLLLLPVAFLCLGSYMHGALYMPHIFSLAVGRPEIGAKSNFLALFIVLPITGTLIYRFGLAGAGFSWVVYHLFAFSYTVPRICRECLQIPIAGWFVHMGRILVLAGLTYGTAWALVELFAARSVPGLALAYLGATALFVLGAYWLMSHELRAALWALPNSLKIRTAQTG